MPNIRQKNILYYITSVLLVIVILFLVSTFNLPGHIQLNRALAQLGVFTGSGTVNYLARFAGAASPSTTLGDSIIYDDGAGHIGIGTAAPSSSSKLDVQGAGFNLLLSRSGLTGAGFHIDTNGDLVISRHGTTGLWEANLLGIDVSAGNVGIGTVAPSSRLTIYDPADTVAGQQIRLGVAAGADYTITRNNTTGYLNFAGSQTGFVGYTFNGNLVFTNYGVGVVGTYLDTRYQNVFSMGTAYVPAADGTALANMYGIAWTHSNIAGQSKAGLSHQALFVAAGVTQTAIGTGIWTLGNLTFGTANPVITASSYITFPGGAFFSGGTTYVGGPLQARAGIYNDSGGNLVLNGGTVNSGTYITGFTGIGTAPTTDQLLVGSASYTAGRTLAIGHGALAPGAVANSISISDISAANEYILQMLSNGTADNEFLFRTDGVALADVSWTGGGADVAEWTPTGDATLQPGDVLVVDGSSPDRLVKKSSASGSEVVVGIVSTNPGLVAGGGSLGSDLAQDPHVHDTLVALAGRVPVKFSEENGPVHAGDRVTASATLPGYAMKMTESGQSIGIALEPSKGNSTKVLIFVGLGYQKLDVAPTACNPEFSQACGIELDEKTSMLDLSLMQELDLNLEAISGKTAPATPGSQSFVAAFFNNVFSKIAAWLGDAKNGVTDIFAGTFHAKDKLCINDTCVTESQLKALLENAGN